MAEDEEKSLKAYPLTLTRVLKTSAKGGEVERIIKRRKAEEQPRKTVPTVEDEREFEIEERGIFEDYTEQPVLFPTTAKETTAPPVKTEK